MSEPNGACAPEGCAITDHALVNSNPTAGQNGWSPDFDLTPVEIPITLSGEKYFLTEAPESVAIAYRNANIRGAKLTDGKVTGIDGIAEADAILVAGCVAQCDRSTGRLRRDPNGDPITVEVRAVKRWPARVVKRLAEKIKDISDLREQPQTEADLEKVIKESQDKLAALRAGRPVEEPGKNSPSAGTTTSP